MAKRKENLGAIHSTKIQTGPTGKIGARSIQPKFQPVRPGKLGRDPFNQNSNRSDRENWGAIHSTKIPTGPTGKIGARSIQPKFQPVRPGKLGRDPFNQNSNRSDRENWGAIHSTKIPTGPTGKIGARSIQPKFPEISVQNSMDRFGPTEKVSKKRVHLLRWTTFPGRTGWNFS